MSGWHLKTITISQQERSDICGHGWLDACHWGDFMWVDESAGFKTAAQTLVSLINHCQLQYAHRYTTSDRISQHVSHPELKDWSRRTFLHFSIKMVFRCDCNVVPPWYGNSEKQRKWVLKFYKCVKTLRLFSSNIKAWAPAPHSCEDITIRNKLFIGQFEENAPVDSTNTLISIGAQANEWVEMKESINTHGYCKCSTEGGANRGEKHEEAASFCQAHTVHFPAEIYCA